MRAGWRCVPGHGWSPWWGVALSFRETRALALSPVMFLVVVGLKKKKKKNFTETQMISANVSLLQALTDWECNGDRQVGLKSSCWVCGTFSLSTCPPVWCLIPPFLFVCLNACKSVSCLNICPFNVNVVWNCIDTLAFVIRLQFNILPRTMPGQGWGKSLAKHNFTFGFDFCFFYMYIFLFFSSY